jgi:alkylation response protein AidB-like acyl-CoA dehydrogenase
VDDSGSIRVRLLAAISERRPEFETAGDRAEAERNLPSGTMATLRELGAFWLKTPAELGGTPLDPLDFCDVLEEFAYVDGATAWAVMVGNGGTGTAGGWLPDAGARRVFVPGRPHPLVVGTPGPRGTGRPAANGYLVSGQWSFASGCGHADWLIGGFRSAGADGQLMVAIVPRDQATIVDNWRVAGLRGSGSFDFRLDEVFVPAELTFERAASACRGGALFNVEAHVFLSNELPPLMTGMARRALDEMAALAGQAARVPGGPSLADRPVFLAELGRAQTRLRAARAAHREAVRATWAAALAGAVPPRMHTDLTVASVFAAETCADVVSTLFRYGGGRLLARSVRMQRLLRDVLAARQHIGLSEEAYERAGRERIAAGVAGPRPSAGGIPRPRLR